MKDIPLLVKMDFRKDFPILNDIIYLDSAATTQRPLEVIDAVNSFYKNSNSNIHRGLYDLAENATLKYEESREAVANFINAEPNEIIFTKNATESINIVMRGYEKHIRHGKITTSVMEHHSNFVPWHYLSKNTHSKLTIIDVDHEGNLIDIEKKIKGANIVAISAASNVLGTINDIKEICKIAKQEGSIIILDGAQYVPSNKINVKDIGCDFLAFSGHKMLSTFGVGVLYGKSDLLEELDPMIYGSEMIREVSSNRVTWEKAPQKFESGTPDPAAVIGLHTAINYLNKIGMDWISLRERELGKYLEKRLSEITGLKIIGNPKNRTAICSFVIEKIHPHDIAAILNENRICVRSGHHCAMPLHERFGLKATTRASCYFYNLESEIDMLAESLEKAKKIFL